MTVDPAGPLQPLGRRRGAWSGGLILTVVIGITVAVGISGRQSHVLPDPAPPALPSDAVATSSGTIETPATTPATAPAPPPAETVPAATGLRWDAAVILEGAGDSASLGGLVVWDGGFAAIQHERQRASRLFLSADGTTWRSTPLPFTAHGLATSVLPLNRGLVLVDESTAAKMHSFETWLSEDGISWQHGSVLRVPAPPRNPPTTVDVFSLGGRLVVTPPLADRASAPSVFISPDGRQWLNQGFGGLGDEAVDVLGVSNGRLYGLHGSGSQRWLAASNNGGDWKDLVVVPTEVASIAATRFVVAQRADRLFMVVVIDDPGNSGAEATRFYRWEGSDPFVLIAAEPLFALGSGTATHTGFIFGGYSYARRGPLAFVSNDGGTTFEPSAGWPDMRGAAVSGLAAGHGVVVAISSFLGDRTTSSSVLVANLP